MSDLKITAETVASHERFRFNASDWMHFLQARILSFQSFNERTPESLTITESEGVTIAQDYREWVQEIFEKARERHMVPGGL